MTIKQIMKCSFVRLFENGFLRFCNIAKLNTIRIFSFFAIILAALFLFCGCGNRIPTHVTEIIVTLDGQPVEGAAVNLVPISDNAMQAFGITDANGRCQTQTLLGKADGGTVVGEYIVTVSKLVSKDTGKTITDQYTGQTTPLLEGEETLPTIYTSDKTSPLKLEVKSGKNLFNAELKK
ncbi:MAG: Ig-like domain-containing protein [Planctomycetaceae bacterium]|jgi:5-hydroxyisourate hydrolase-like protein (transthyretin family)|nr:Ig-like domain-containing protein [Planctomycetaceae bacterium]